MLGLTSVELLLITLAITTGSLIQSSLGFGSALVALPVLASISPVFAPGPLMAAGVLMGFLILVRDRSELDFQGVKFAWLGQILGIAGALIVMELIPKEEMTIFFGVALIGAVALSTNKFCVRITRRALFLAGTLSGFMGTTSALGGAPLGILYQNAPGKRLRATLACLLLVGSGSVLVALLVSGHFGRAEWQATLLLLPGCIAGYALSWPVARYLDAGRVRVMVLAFSGIGGAFLVGRAL